VRCRVNGELRQDGTTADLVFGVAELVSYCAAFATLLPGDVLLTGTPAGVGPLVAGDRVEVEIEGLGVLGNPVVADD
jgi:2-keto-4-pentenoate hydratase/2-oxohepta-3-ene-1,7-dioic acid hydratase in catechol pathway